MKKLQWIKMVATGFGTGFSPVLPGTAGTLWGIPLAWAVFQLPELWMHIAACVFLTVLAVPVCAIGELLLMRGNDPGCIVADEFFTLPICFLGLPFTVKTIMTGFIFHRIFDITKPPPIRQLQKIKGGTGIVIDDFLAALLALAANHFLWRVIY